MTSEPPQPREEDEICPICNKAKSKHMPKEMLACSRKIQESRTQNNDKSL